MRLTPIALAFAVLAASSLPALAADATAGRQKAALCVACHGNESFGGIFYTLQLAGRNADKLTVKTNKYRSGKILHPMMNLAAIPPFRKGCRGHLGLLPVPRQARRDFPVLQGQGG